MFCKGDYDILYYVDIVGYYTYNLKYRMMNDVNFDLFIFVKFCNFTIVN